MIYTDGQYLEDMHAWYCDWLIPIKAVAKRDNCMAGGGGGGIFRYSCSHTVKEIRLAEHEYMNIPPPPPLLVKLRP